MTLPHSLNQLLTEGGKKEMRIHSLAGGLIHQTFQLWIDQQPFLLQSVNTNIFPEPEKLIQNHRVLYRHFLSADSPFSHPLAEPLPFPNGEWIYRDEEKNSWRRTSFIPNSYSRTEVEDASQAEELAHFFARFTQYASTLDPRKWQIPLPGFHDLRKRYDEFQTAIESDRAGRKIQSTELINELLKRKEYVDFFDRLRDHTHYPLRMMHHDAKLSNVLIDERFNTWLCPVDLDTVMPGYFFSDLGDMARSICSAAPGEDSPEAQIGFRSDLYEALLRGYRKGLHGSLSGTENQQLDMAGVLMTYMQVLRFLTDHLNGDKYYRIDRTDQNLYRARNQYCLLQQMEEYLGDRLGRSGLR